MFKYKFLTLSTQISFMTDTRSEPLAPWQIMLVLILAGEIIFGLPFQTLRFFRASFLEVFQLTNTQLGDVFAVYGVMAMLAYFPGGALADRLAPRKLMAISLFATALGGIYYATIPSYLGMQILFGYWGITSILLFWAAMIKATREWGGNIRQGKAFGLLDGGRGLVAAIISSIAVVIFSFYLPDNSGSIIHEQRVAGVQSVIYFYTVCTFVMAAFAWILVPTIKQDQLTSTKQTFSGISHVIKQKSIWCQAFIVICAYCGYKGIDNYSLYAVTVLNMTELEAAQITSLASYIRPIAAFAAGCLADRIASSKTIIIGFGIALLSYGVMFVSDPAQSFGTLSTGSLIIFINLIISMFAVFAIRGVYFALIAESKTKTNVTGTAVGLVSVLGFTPDIFFASITGRILDANEGLIGFQNYFLLLCGISIIGLISCLLFVKIKRNEIATN